MSDLVEDAAIRPNEHRAGRGGPGIPARAAVGEKRRFNGRRRESTAIPSVNRIKIHLGLTGFEPGEIFILVLALTPVSRRDNPKGSLQKVEPHARLARQKRTGATLHLRRLSGLSEAMPKKRRHNSEKKKIPWVTSGPMLTQ